MAEVVLATESEKQVWDSEVLSEFVRASRFKPYMGKGATNIIIVKHELETQAGKTINIPMLTRLNNKGVGGATALRGRETQLGNYNCPISIDWDRNAVIVPKSESFKTEIDLLNEAKPLLRQWGGEALRTDVIYSLMSVCTGGNVTVVYAEITEDTTNGGFQIANAYVAGSTFDRYDGVTWTTATEANKDAWLALNSDRVLFGKLRSNISGNDHSVALATLDTTDDKLTSATASLAKRMAGTANPHITPYMTEDGREFYVMFCGPRSFRDLKQDTAIIAANRDARAREGSGMDKNPLFQDGDLMYDGILFREVPEIPHITNAGASGTTDVEPNFLCGQQALGIAWGQTPTGKAETNDYGFRPGVAIEELRGVKKLTFNGKQNGVVTVYTAAGADA
jgi:N4-gp56 family major capsid protein